MVSDPNNQADNTTAAPAADAVVIATGFSTTPVEAETVAETADNRSLSRQFRDGCDRLWAQMGERARGLRKSFAPGDEGSDPYRKLWWRQSLGNQVFDCGNCIRMAGTREKPVTEKQIQNMILGALAKNPPWETIYMWNHKGRPDPLMGQRVQQVIDAMRQQGMIPPESRIHVSLRYPCDHINGFSKHLKSLFSNAAQAGDQAANPDARAGIHARPRAGLHAV